MLSKRQKKSWSISPLQWTWSKMRQNPAWSPTKNQLPTVMKHNISDNLILLFPHGHVAPCSHWVTANSKINLLNTQTLKCWEYYTMRNTENSILFCCCCCGCCGVICYSSVLEKVKWAVGVIKITKCLPYGKHLNIPELLSQENKTAECYKILRATEEANRKWLSTASSHTNWAELMEN